MLPSWRTYPHYSDFTFYWTLASMHSPSLKTCKGASPTHVDKQGERRVSKMPKILDIYKKGRAKYPKNTVNVVNGWPLSYCSTLYYSVHIFWGCCGKLNYDCITYFETNFAKMEEFTQYIDVINSRSQYWPKGWT